jgi:hypothetical protein
VTVGRGRLYPQLLRRPGTRWWQAPLTVVLVGLFFGVLSLFLVLFEIGFYGGFGFAMGVQPDGSYGGQAPVLYTVAQLVVLAVLVVLATCWAYSVRPGWLASVQARLRPRVLAATLPVALVAGLGSWGLAAGTGTAPEPDDPATIHAVTDPVAWVAIGVLLALATAVLDEVAFRGWLTQALGSLVEDERVALAVAGLGGAVAYAWWHRAGSVGGLVLAVLVGLVLVAVATATGGLEAPFAVSVGLTAGLVVPYAARYGLDVAMAPRPASWTDVVVAVVAGAAAVGLARLAGAARRGQPEGEQRGLSDLSGVRGVR